MLTAALLVLGLIRGESTLSAKSKLASLAQTLTLTPTLADCPKSLGCFRDCGNTAIGEPDRDLPIKAYTNDFNFRPIDCVSSCGKLGYAYAGIQFGTECWCGDSYGNLHGGSPNCNYACGGNPGELCGGYCAQQVYETAQMPTITPSGWESMGCFADQSNRDLQVVAIMPKMSMEFCATICRSGNFQYMGLQNAEACTCGNSYGKYGAANNCTKPCNGNAAQICGNVWSQNIYKLQAGSPSVPATAPTTTPATGWQPLGCFADAANRDLADVLVMMPKMTMEMCAKICRSGNFQYMGLQNAEACVCGNSYGKYGAATNCTKTCNGNADQICGNVWASNVYKLDSAVVMPTIPPSGWQSLGCFADAAARDLPDVLAIMPKMTQEFCALICRSGAFGYMGLQNAEACVCGNSYGKYGTATNCTKTCNGNSAQTCGNVWSSNIYKLLL